MTATTLHGGPGRPVSKHDGNHLPCDLADGETQWRGPSSTVSPSWSSPGVGSRGRRTLSPRAAKSAARGAHVSGGPRPAEAQAEAELTCQQNPPASRRSFRLKSLNAGRFLSRLKASLIHRTQVTGAAVDTGPTERVLTVHAEGTAASAKSGHCRDPPFHFLPSLGSGVTTFLPVAA